MKKSIGICGIVGFLIFLLCNVSFASLNVPLTVSDYSGIARVSDPVTSGIPIPESANIISINQLQMTDSSGNNVPAQFTVTSRWRGTPDDSSKPIKWVLLDFQADVPADGTSVYYLKNGDIGDAQDTNLILQQDDNKITVSTGKAKFEINKNYFNLFDYVYVDKDNDGQLNDMVVSSVNDGGVVLTGTDGTIYRTTLEAPEEIKIEEQGPMRSVVKVRGVFKAEDGSYFAPSINNTADATKENFNELGYAYMDSGIVEGSFSQPYPSSIFYYNCRIHFYNDKDYVKVFLTLENNGANGMTNPEYKYAPIQIVYFDSINLIIKPNDTNQINIISEDSSVQLDSPDNFTLYQNWKENLTDSHIQTLEPNFEKGIYYTIQKNSQELSTGSTNPGWVDANSNAQGIGLAIRHFWQNFPKKITANNSEIKIGFWPEEGYYPYCLQSDFSDPKFDVYCKEAGRDAGNYLFGAGRHKTYEMFLRFYPGSQDSQTQTLSKSLENPLMALASSEWYAQTKALGMIGPAGLTSIDPELNEAMERFERLQTALVYEEDSDNQYTINNLKTTEYHHSYAIQNRFFNWMNFGDLMWMNSISANLHYDWSHSMLLHYIRTGKRNFFDTGVEMAKHQYDIDQYHGERTATNGHHLWINYMAFYEGNGHDDPAININPSVISKPSHTWSDGMVLYYLLTGDKKSLEAAEEVRKGAFNQYTVGGLTDASNPRCCSSGELRRMSWPILNLINLYRATGKEEDLDLAKKVAKNILLYTEQQQTGQGYWGDGTCENMGSCGLCVDYQGSTMYVYVIDALINIHYETQDEELKQLLIRMADFSKDMFLYGGDYNEGGMYMPLQTQYSWGREDLGGGEPVKSIWFGNLFAYAYNLTGDAIYLDWARKSFRDGMFYYAMSGDSYMDPKVRSKVSFVDSMFSGTQTKAHGWIGRTNQVYLYTEWQLQQGELQIVSNSLPDGTVDLDYSYPVSVAGGTSPYTWTYSDIPSWLTVNTVSETMRKISGIPPQAGSFSFTVQIEDSASATVTKQFTLEVKEQADSDSIAITTQSLPEAIVGSEYVASLNVSGGSQPYTWSIDSGELPAGMYLEGNTILGIPEETGLYEFIVTVNDGSQEAAKDLCIEVTISDTDVPDTDVPDTDVPDTDVPDTDVPDTDIPDIKVYETNCDFGSVNIGKSAGWTFVIFNSGTTALTIQNISSDNQVFFIDSSFFPAEIASGETLNVPVRFTPQVEGKVSGTLVINSNDSDEEEITISIVGTGDNSANAPNVVTVTFRDSISDTTLDGYLEARKDKNLGGMGELNIWSDGVRRILLRPDLSQIPANAVIEKVELRLYCYSHDWPSYDPRLEVYQITHDWEEGEGIWYVNTNGGATWNEYDRDPLEINEWDMPGGDIDTITDFGCGANGIVSEAVMQEESWVAFDITDLAQKWISNEMENYGILIQAIDRGCNAANFYSSEYEDENLRPVLVVSHSDGSTEALDIHSELSQATQGSDYEVSISASGGNLPYQWSIQGLPAGLDWRDLNDTTITIYGIPAESGQFSLEVTVEDDNAQTLTMYLALTIVDPIFETVTLRDSISDTTLDGYLEARKDKNLGGMGNLNIWSDGVRRILLRPDLSQIPANAVIEKAELRLYCYSHYWPSYDPRLEVYQITHDWEEGEGIWYVNTNGGATWNEYDRDPLEINEWDMPGGDIDTITDFGYGPNGIVSEAVMQEESWVAFDITDLAQKWVSNEMENYGILIQAIHRGYNEAKFYSSEYEDEDLRPNLTIQYLP